jgi:hypothetical protein
MSFTSGFIGGLAKSIDERLKDGMRRTEERADRILERTSIRAEREQQRAEEEQREVADLLSEFASLIDESQVPEGMTLMDYAAGLYRRGGGTISGAKSYLEDLRAHEKGGGSVSSLVDYASLKTGGYGEADYVKKFVRQPDTLVKVPKGMRGGAGLYGKLFDVDVTEGLQDEIFATYGKPEETPDFQMGQLGFREGAQLLPTADIIQKRKLADIQIQQAEANLASTIEDNKLKGAIDLTQVNRDFNTVLKGHLNKSGMSYETDTQGNPIFNVKTGDQQFTAVQNSYSNALRNVTENAVGSLNVPGMKQTLKTLSETALGYVTPNDPSKTGNANYKVGDLIVNKDGHIYLWMGDADNSLLIRKK